MLCTTPHDVLWSSLLLCQRSAIGLTPLNSQGCHLASFSTSGNSCQSASTMSRLSSLSAWGFLSIQLMNWSKLLLQAFSQCTQVQRPLTHFSTQAVTATTQHNFKFIDLGLQLSLLDFPSNVSLSVSYFNSSLELLPLVMHHIGCQKCCIKVLFCLWKCLCTGRAHCCFVE